MFVEVRLVGRLFLPEIILLGLFPLLLLNRAGMLLSALPRTFIMLGLLWLSSQIVTDIIRSTPFEDYSRGWSNIIVFLIEFLTIYLLAFESERRLILFAVGVIVGQLLQYIIAPNIFAAGGEFWKFGIGYAVTLFMVLTTQLRPVSRRFYLGPAILFAAAILNLVMGTRSLGGICFIAALYLLLQKLAKPNKLMIITVSNKKLLLTFFLLLASGVIALKFYGLIASGGMLGEDIQEKYESQADGEFGLLIGGRPELLVSSLAILDSPIIGHGSWAVDPKYVSLLAELLLKYSYDTRPIAIDDELSDIIPTHSFIFGAWVSAGLLGAVFWLWIMIFCAKLLIILCKIKDPLTPLVVFLGFNMLWNILFSPFGAETRPYTAYYLVLLMFVHCRSVAAAGPSRSAAAAK